MLQIINLVLSVLILIMAASTLFTYFKRKKALGEELFKGLGGIAHSDFVFQFILVASLMALTIWMFLNDATAMTEFLAFYIAFPIAILIFFVNTLVQALAPKGFYKNGICTSNGIITYSEVKDYRMEKLDKKNCVRIRFNAGSGGLFKGNMYLDIENHQTNEIKALLKKRCSFKKK